MKNKITQSLSLATKTLILVAILFFETSTTQAQIITTIAGDGIVGYSGDSGIATSAELNIPYGVAVDASGNVYISDTYNNVIRKVNASTGIITTVAGNGTLGSAGDGGLATSAELLTPWGLAIDASGNIYIAEGNDIRKVNASTGIITTVAGNGTSGYNGDNILATSAELWDISGVAVDAAGNIYITDDYNFRIRKVNASTGIITTIAGNGTSGYSGDNALATSAKLCPVGSVAIDVFGNIYVADGGNNNNRIRKITVATGIITTVAGDSIQGYGGDNGLAISAELNQPYGVALDSSRNIYILDTYNFRIRKVNASTGIITTVAGNGTSGYNGDNILATSAELGGPYGIASDVLGNIFLADEGNSRIRKVSACSVSVHSQIVIQHIDTNALVSIDTTITAISDTLVGKVVKVVTTTDTVFISTYMSTVATIRDSTVFSVNQCDSSVTTKTYSDTTVSSTMNYDTTTHQSADTTTLLNTGLENVDLSLAIKVYPNPFGNELNVDVGSEVSTIVLTDALGRTIIQTKGTGHVILQLNISSGVYFLRVTGNDISSTTIKVLAE
jgi:sugar lactone lactonase YvrE